MLAPDTPAQKIGLALSVMAGLDPAMATGAHAPAGDATHHDRRVKPGDDGWIGLRSTVS
jgi:hypothetical protein